MNNLTNELNRLRAENSDVALILDVFEEIDHVYRETMEAMGIIYTLTPEVKNSAEITVSFRPTPSSGD